MTVAQTEKLLKILRTNGVSYFKSDDIEIRLDAVESPKEKLAAVESGPALPNKSSQKVPRKTELPSSERVLNLEPQSKFNPKSSKQANAGDIPIKNVDIPHHLNQMVSVLKMDDEQLVDMLFPEGKPLEQPQVGN